MFPIFRLLFNRKPLLIVLLALAAGPPLASAQGAATPTPLAYDVMTIKPNKTLSGSISVSIDNGNYSASNISLKQLLQNAYDVKEDLISGIPGPLDSARFDIEAKVVEPDLKVMESLTPEQQRAMLLPLLIERFHLATHIESKVLPVYELVLLPGGPKFSKSPGEQKPGNGSMSVHNRSLAAHDLPMGSLARMLADIVHRTVLDKTGLPGNYTLELKWSPDDLTDLPADAPPPIFTAVQDQLGLKLRPAKGPVDTLVVDHAEMPTAN